MTTQLYGVITSKDGLKHVLKAIEQAPVYGLDLETTGLRHWKDSIVGIALSIGEDRAWYIPIRHLSGEQLPASEVLGALKPILEGAKAKGQTICIHHAKFDTGFLRKEGIRIPDEAVHDTILETFALGDMERKLGLKDLIQSQYGHTATTFDSLFPPGAEKNIAMLPFDQVGPYASQDADYCFRLHRDFHPQVKGKLAYHVEQRLWPVLRETEAVGLPFDMQVYWRMMDHAVGTLRGMELMIAKYPTEFNTRALERVKGLQNDLKGLSLSSWVEEDGRVRPTYRQVASNIGDCTSDFPCLELVARHRQCTVETPDISNRMLRLDWDPKLAFISDSDDYYLLEASYRQPEWLLLGIMAEDDDVVQDYQYGDVHAGSAGRALGKHPSLVTPSERSNAKWQGYREIYGPLECPRPKLRAFQEQLSGIADVAEQVQTAFGRQIPVKTTRPGVVTQLAVKGSASDLNKAAVLRLAEVAKNRYDSNQVRLAAFIGGAQIWEVHKTVKPWVIGPLFAREMERLYPEFPLKAVIKAGVCWGDLTPVGKV